MCLSLSVPAQEVVWQRDIKSSTQDFLSQVTTTIDGQYLISGSSIQSNKLSAEIKQNNGYDFHLVKLNHRGKKSGRSISRDKIMIFCQLQFLRKTVDFYFRARSIQIKVWIKKKIPEVARISG